MFYYFMFKTLKTILVFSSLILSACQTEQAVIENDIEEESASSSEVVVEDNDAEEETEDDEAETEPGSVDDEDDSELVNSEEESVSSDLEPNTEGTFSAPSTPPAGTVTETIEINENVPYFSDEDLTLVEPNHQNAEFDGLGRVGVANALIGTESMPSEERGSISHIEPTGWNQARYANIGSGGWLYNRSHLIAHQLTGVDEPENLMTGTRWFNEEMIDFENFIAFYIEETDNHVRFRVSPIFEDDNLLASGAYMEGFSIEDNGDGLMFNIYIPNIQEGVNIDYQTGESIGMEGPAEEGELHQFEEEGESDDEPLIKGNINSSGEKIYHKPGDAHYDRTIIDESQGERYFQSEEEAQEAGWRPAQR